MRTIVFGFLIAVFAAGCDSGVVNGNGRTAQTVRDLPPFHTLVIEGDFSVLAQHGMPAKAELEADGNLLKEIQTHVANGILTLTSEKELNSKNPLRIRLISPTLHTLTHLGRGPVTIKLLDAATFTVNNKNTGSLSGIGNVRELNINAEGSGEIALDQLDAVTARITSTRSADIYATVTASVTAYNFGSRTISVEGSPRDIEQRNHADGQILIK